MNLLSNAFKFTFEGSIRIAVRGARGRVELTVAGHRHAAFPTTKLERVFERFHRVEGARSRTHEGSGIGLALTHELVRLHGGDITVSSRLRRRLHVHRPDSRPAARTCRRTAWPPGRNRRRRREARRRSSKRRSRWLAQDSDGLSGAHGLARSDPRRRRQRRHARLPARSLLRGWDVETVVNGAEALGACARVAAGPGGHRRDDARARWLRPAVGAAGRSADQRHPGADAVGAIGRGGACLRAGRRRRRLRHQAVQRPRADRARVRSLLALAEARREADLQKQHLHTLFMQAPTPIVILRGSESHRRAGERDDLPAVGA